MALLGLGTATGFAADDFPTKPIKIVVPFKAGGGMDVSTRFLATAGEKYFGQPVVVENRPGGSGLIGAGEVANAPADGYTLLATTSGSYGAAPHIYKPPYDPKTAFVPVISPGSTAMILVAGPSAPTKDFKSFYDYAKAHPNQVTVGCAGYGDISGMQLAKAFRAMGLKVRIVPFNGASETAANTLGGHVMYGNISDSTAKSHIEKGTLKPIFVFGGKVKRAPFDAIPSLPELGYKNGDSAYYKLIVAPAGTPAPVLEKLREGFMKITEDAAVEHLFVNAGASLDGVTNDPAYLKEVTEDDYKTYGEIVSELGLAKN
jgi:tripartite-type tricarboxylate transporter receptor subunit TctC